MSGIFESILFHIPPNPMSIRGSYTPIEHYQIDDRATNGETLKYGN
jgi:hypothetical protein